MPQIARLDALVQATKLQAVADVKAAQVEFERAKATLLGDTQVGQRGHSLLAA